MSHKEGSAFLLNLLVKRGFNIWNPNQSHLSLWTLESPLKEVEGYNRKILLRFDIQISFF